MEISRNPTIGYEGKKSQRRTEKNESFVKSAGSDQKVRDGTNPSNLYDYLRCLRLQILGYLIAWREPTERPKVAIYNRHWSALYHVMLHMIPLSGAAVLIILNWSCVFLGSDFNNAIWLQFVAKFHELLMQTSIAEVVLAIIRGQLINNYLPLGALSAATQSYQISYLWSLDFFSSITSREIPASRKVLFATLIPLLVILTAVVGPSTATLMIPRPNVPQLITLLKQSSFSSQEVMFPSRVILTAKTKVNINSFARTNQDNSIVYGAVENGYALPQDKTSRYERTVYNSDLPNSPRKIRISIGQGMRFVPYLDGNATFFSAIATMPTQFAVQGMRFLEKGLVRTRNTSISVNIPHPVVATKCIPPKYFLTSETNVSYIRDDGKSQATLSKASELLDRLLGRDSTGLMSHLLPPIWSQSPEPNSSTLIGTFIKPWKYDNIICQYSEDRSYPAAQMFSEEHRRATEECFQLITCNVQAFWKSSLNEITYADQTPVAQTPLILDAGFDRVYQENPITLDLSEMASFNNENFVNILPFGTHGPVEDTLSAVFVNALANAPDIRFVSGSVENDQHPTFDFKATQYGYGYDGSPISVRLSMAVISIYLLVTITYLLYILTVGYTSTSWSTAIELILLALQSKRPEDLKNVSAGADSMLTYQKSVGVRVNERHELALVFPNEPDTELGRMRKVVPNKLY